MTDLFGHNNPPKLEWRRWPWACGCIAHQLYVDGVETPFRAERACASHHRQHRDYAASLFGNGMCSKSGCAATLGVFRNVTLAKARAERLWQEWSETGELERRIAAGKAAAKTRRWRWA